MENKRYTVSELEALGFELHKAGDLMIKEGERFKEIYIITGSKNGDGESLFMYESTRPVYSNEVAGL